MDIVGALEASGDGNRKSQVSDEGMEGEKTERDDGNRRAFSRGYEISVVKTSKNL